MVRRAQPVLKRWRKLEHLAGQLGLRPYNRVAVRTWHSRCATELTRVLNFFTGVSDKSWVLAP